MHAGRPGEYMKIAVNTGNGSTRLKGCLRWTKMQIKGDQMCN
jgi:hypothetical protein